MTWKLVGNRWRWVLMVALVSLASAAPWFALTGQAPGNFAPRPPWINADGTGNPPKLPDVVPIRDNTGTIIGWAYIPQVPTGPPSAAEIVQIPADIQAKLDRGEHPVRWEERPGVTRIFHEDGGEEIITNWDVANPLHRDPGDHPIFSTKAEAERYAATQR